MPQLTQARAPLVRELAVMNEFGDQHKVYIPDERALTVYVDKRELVTLMTLGAHPEWLVLGYLRNQRLVASVEELEAISVDWDVSAAAVKTRHGIADIESRTSTRVVTTGCGQGSVFGDLMADVDTIVLPPATLTQADLYSIVNAIRLHESIYRVAGSVHGCALFKGAEMLMFVEDVGRHSRRFLCFSAPQRLVLQPELAGERPLVEVTARRHRVVSGNYDLTSSAS
jgi:FdhD protein